MSKDRFNAARFQAGMERIEPDASEELRLARRGGSRLKRGEVWWADLGPYRPLEQTGRRPVVVWQSDALTKALQSVLVVPLTTNLDRSDLAATALVSASWDHLAATAHSV